MEFQVIKKMETLALTAKNTEKETIKHVSNFTN